MISKENEGTNHFLFFLPRMVAVTELVQHPGWRQRQQNSLVVRLKQQQSERLMAQSVLDAVSDPFLLLWIP